VDRGLSEPESPRNGGGILVVLSGPSGVGKGTVLGRAMSCRNPSAARLRRSISVTTRGRRPDEREGRDYFFRTLQEFDLLVADDELLEWANYLDNRYGTPRRWVEEQLAAGQDVVLEIEVQGARQVRERCPEAVLVYILPPSWRALRHRLATRRSESEQLQRRRVEVAKEELEYLDRYHYAIVNDRVGRAAQKLLAILAAEHARVARRGARRLIGSIRD